MNYKNYLFLSKNPDGSYSFLGKRFDKKPYWFIGKKSCYGLILNIIVFMLLENSADFMTSKTQIFIKYVVIFSLIGIMGYLYFIDWREYKKLK